LLGLPVYCRFFPDELFVGRLTDTLAHLIHRIPEIRW
jgi:hypothetical protein